MRAMRLITIASVLLLLPGAAAAHGATSCCAHQALAEFLDGVHEYVELHRAVVADAGPEQTCADPEQLQRNTAALAAAIRVARPVPQAPRIFTPRVTAFLRATLASAAGARYDLTALYDDMDREGPPAAALEPNGEFPWSAGNVMPPGLLRVLPALPEELEYRFVGADLVLLDVRANLVVDVLEDALPRTPPLQEDHAAPGESDTGEDAPHQPCDVHPELPACWM